MSHEYTACLRNNCYGDPLPRRAERRNAPPDVQRLIDFVNSISPQLDRPHITDYPALQALMKQLTSNKQFREFRQVTGLRNPIDLLNRYVDLHETRDLLRWIAHLKPGTHEARAPLHTHFVSMDAHGKVHFTSRWPELEGVEAARIRQCPAPLRRSVTDRSTQPPTDRGGTKWLKWHCGRMFWVKMLGKRTMTGCCPTHTASIKMRRLREGGYKW